MRDIRVENIIYSVWIRRGPDIVKYDLIFGETELRLRYLGEYWATVRPRTGLQQRADMFLYSIRKKRVRNGKEESEIIIPYCSIKEISLKKPAHQPVTESKKSINQSAALIIRLVDGKVVTIEFAPKVYKLVKEAIKKHLLKALENCPGMRR
jgi:hypothetical protein